MSDPRAEEDALTGMLPNGAFAGNQPDWSTGQGGDVPTDDLDREGEPDPGPEEVEPGQD